MQRYQNSLQFKFFPISVEGGGGHRKSIFSQIQKSPNYPRGGGGGQENYGLFPQIMVFFILNRPLRTSFLHGKVGQIYFTLATTVK